MGALSFKKETVYKFGFRSKRKKFTKLLEVKRKIDVIIHLKKQKK